jgi:hypothetical protein
LGAGKNNLGPALAIFNSHNIGADAITDGVFFGADAFAGRHDSFKFSKIQDNIATIKSADSAADNLSGAILKLLIDHLFLNLTDALSNSLTSCLGGNASEIARRDLDLDLLADLGLRID